MAVSFRLLGGLSLYKKMFRCEARSIEPVILYPAFLSAVAFLIYGFLCVFTSHMRDEFERFGMARFRLLTGALEILGATGTLVGLFWMPLFIFSTLGLGTLMLLGLITRIRLKDPVLQMLPAFVLMLVNYFLAGAVSIFSDQ